MKISAKTAGFVDASVPTSLKISTDREDETFSDLQVDFFDIQASRLKGCVFTRIRSRQACFGSGSKMPYLEECVFDRCDLKLSVAGNARLVRCRFVDSILRDVIALDLELVECVFENTKINRAAFHSRVPADDVHSLGRSHNDFRGNDFSSATLKDVGFNGGISLAAQILPQGEDYLYIADTTAATAWLKKASMPSDPKAAKVQKGLLGLMNYFASTGQKDQFITGPFPAGFREATTMFGSLEA